MPLQPLRLSSGYDVDHDDPPEPFDSERLPPTLAREIQMFLRVANSIQTQEPRVAYMCRFQAFEIAHNMDRNSSGRGVRQFKTSLLRRLEHDDKTTYGKRKEKTDIRELRRVYQAYKQYIIKSGGGFDFNDSHRKTVTNATRITSVLYEVLKTFADAAGHQALAAELYVPYNILPLDHGGIQQAIMQLPEIKAAVAAVRNIRGLPSAQDFHKCGPFIDLFDFLQCCFGFQMAYELHGMLTGDVSLITGEKVMPAYGGGFESFLNNEAEKNKSGTADHSTWRNYDDLNEYFWSPDCFQIGWPMRLDHEFFCVQASNKHKVKKTAMIIMACHDLGSPLEMLDAIIFEDVMSVFITCAILKLIQAILDIVFTWKARFTMDISRKRKLLLKLLVAIIWTIVLPVYYAKSRKKYACYSTQYGSWLGQLCFSSYMVAVAIYLMTNAIEMVLFFVPVVSKYIEISNNRICKTLSWWTQPRLYVGRGMQETQISVFKYTLFWVLVLLSKFLFSYCFEIKPLIGPTRLILKIGVQNYDWHELFPKVKSNAGAIVAIWAPIIVVYFMDTQIWYSVFCAIFGGLYGIIHHLGEIRTLGMLRSRFHTLPSAFNVCLIPPSAKNDQKTEGRRNFFRNRFHKVSETRSNAFSNFVLVWNQIINTFRLEDLISNRELDLMKIPMSSELFSNMVRWPIFLLANKFSTAISITRDFVGKDDILLRKIKKDKYMYSAVKECYESLKYVLEILIVGNLEKRVVSCLLNEIEGSIGRSSLLEDFKMSELPVLLAKCTELVELLVEGNENQHGNVVRVLQDMFELVTNDIMTNSSRILDLLSPQQVEDSFAYFSRTIEPQLFESADDSSINFPLPDTSDTRLLNEQFKLSITPDSPEFYKFLQCGHQRLTWCKHSNNQNDDNLYLLVFDCTKSEFENHIAKTNKVCGKPGLMPFELIGWKPNHDEWKNFLERMDCEYSDVLKDESKKEELRNWASFRSQTLSRTVRGMMYYREALRVQAFLDMAKDEEIVRGLDGAERNNPALFAQLDALADLKFTYIISCQIYGSQKSSGDPHANDILELMKRYASVRVAYVEEKEEIVNDKPRKVYSSILVKAVDGLDQEIYRIKLPGPPNIGEGKPENQNHAIIFTRGEALQTIDMNQDNYLEEAFKMRNLLQEFFQQQGRRPPTILGLREHIFTGSVSSLAWFMSYQETSFVTIGQRLIANPLRVRFHYGHPDVFDRLFHITRGGISKASKTINLSEDVFAGFNSTLRRGCITYHEYLQVGKGRDVGLNQISKFEAKVANGNSEQTLSRDIYRLGQWFDFFRMLSCYFTTIGFYFSNLISVIGIYVFLYGQLYLVLSGLQKTLVLEARMHNIQSLETALASQSFIQLGLLTGLPMVMEIGLEKGFLTAFKDFILMQLQLAAVFFTFSLGTKIHHYGRTILYGGASTDLQGVRLWCFMLALLRITDCTPEATLSKDSN
ncbi:hypothetical protein GH714_026752 [Hevea brasiliensis]|uniref:1,3-beta-glucan synthase n=1 Tax=Hevea brasiliensis TaxID=3981 RepID=A0A6A6MQC7_HEVBR|nr:hypothetical protein GH714_026752 [Hevea brasiliensis]